MRISELISILRQYAAEVGDDCDVALVEDAGNSFRVDYFPCVEIVKYTEEIDAPEFTIVAISKHECLRDPEGPKLRLV